MMFCNLDTEIWTIKRFTDVGIIKVTHNFNIIQLLVYVLTRRKYMFLPIKESLQSSYCSFFFFFFLGFCCYCVSVLSEKDLLFLTPVDNK